MGQRQRYRLRAASDREVIRELEPGKAYVDKETGEEFEVVGKLTPLAPSASELPYAVEYLRLCGCSLEQLVPKDLNDCPHCGRRLPALEADPGSNSKNNSNSKPDSDVESASDSGSDTDPDG
jgi:hypothetical protein